MKMNKEVFIDGVKFVPEVYNKTYNQSEVDAIRADTWKAARLVHPLAGMKFNTYEDYLEFKERVQQSKQSAPEPSALPTKGNTVTDNSDVACLSLNDVKELWDKHYGGNLLIRDFANSLQKFVNQKLKQ